MTGSASATIRIPGEKQGQTGLGQGGWSCYELARRIDAPVTIALRSAIPLDTDLSIRQIDDDRWTLTDPASDRVILEATRWEPHYPTTAPLTIQEAEAARAAFAVPPGDHPAPHCLSCGIGERTLGVHAGPLDDGRWATSLRWPDWAISNGAVDEGLVWMALDCASGWYTSRTGTIPGSGLTVQYAVDVHRPIDPSTEYAIVAWHGDHIADWDGRKRGAAAAFFDADGELVAQSRSFWVRPA